MHRNIIERYEECFRQNSELPALSDYLSGKTYTYQQLAAKIGDLHKLFKSKGIDKDDKIALVGKNSTDWICIYLGIITYGAVVVPILPDFNPIDMAGIIRHSDARMLFADKNILDRIGLENISCSDGIFSIEDIKDPDFSTFDVSTVKYDIPDDEHVIIISYTSGTTGSSKGVMLPVRSISNNVQFALDQNFHFKGSRVLALLPLAHAYGCAFDMLTPLSVGAHVYVLGKTPTPRLVLEALGSVKPHLVCAVPLIMEKIVRKNVMPALEKMPLRLLTKMPFINTIIYKKIRAALYNAFGGCIKEVNMGGAALARDVEKLLLRMHFPFTVGYGMTECGPLISYDNWDKFKPGSCGSALPGMEIKLDTVGYKKKGIGEIRVKGVNVMTGYYKNPEATAAVLEDGWFRTGDIGEIDRNGHVFLRGRCKSMILTSSGQNIYPEEIESKLNNLPEVLESVVYEDGGKLIALVYVDPESVKKSGFDNIQELMNSNLTELNTKVAPYEKVAEIRLCSTPFEKTPKQSIKRFLYPKAAQLLKKFNV